MHTPPNPPPFTRLRASASVGAPLANEASPAAILATLYPALSECIHDSRDGPTLPTHLLCVDRVTRGW